MSSKHLNYGQRKKSLMRTRICPVISDYILFITYTHAWHCRYLAETGRQKYKSIQTQNIERKSDETSSWSILEQSFVPHRAQYFLECNKTIFSVIIYFFLNVVILWHIEMWYKNLSAGSTRIVTHFGDKSLSYQCSKETRCMLFSIFRNFGFFNIFKIHKNSNFYSKRFIKISTNHSFNILSQTK